MRFLRKHRTALIALAVYHFVFFFPTLFMGRLPSPNDVFFNYSPWSHSRTVEVQNSLINDPPTSYFTLMSLVKSDWQAFHWNPFIGSGVPGFGSSAAAVLSPFVLLPTLALPLTWVYAALIFLKLTAAFLFAYLWLREERLGRGGAAVGAIILAASGAYAVRWWWQATNATTLYPALLWIVRRAMRGRRVPFWLATMVVAVYALAGSPAAMAYGAYLAVAYAVTLAIRDRRLPVVRPVIALLAGALIAMPAIVPFVQLLRRSGYLAARAGAALQSFPLRHFALFVLPDHLGNNARHDWSGDGTLGAANNYVAATVYLGLIPIVLIAFALFNRRANTRWFWIATLAFILLCMFGASPVTVLVSRLPLTRYSPLTQMVLILPVAAGYLGAAASSMLSRHRATIGLLAALIAADLGVFAGRFYPYITSDVAMPPVTPTIAFLQQQPKPFRIAPFMNYLWPNTSELYRLEDVRSHFSSEADYRLLLQRIDPTSSSDQHTVISFNSLKFNFSDPFTAMLGVRYYVEHKEIDIVRWTIFQNSEPGVVSNGILTMQHGMVLTRTIVVDDRPFYALEMPVTFRAGAASSRLVVTLSRGSAVLFQRAFTPSDISVMNKIYVPIYTNLRPGDEASLEVRSDGMRAEIVRGADQPLYYDRVKIPLMFDRELPDGRIFRNAGEVPRFHSVRRVSSMTHDDFLTKTLTVDFRDEAILTGGDAPVATADAAVTVRRYEEARQEIEVDAPAGTFLASSEKLTPELEVTIDRRRVNPMEINLLFAGVRVPPGKHVVMFSRRIARGWWGWSIAAALFAMVFSVIDVVRPR